MTTATAQANPNLAFIKYWGNRDNDLRQYHFPADRKAVLEGYLESGPVSEEFIAIWRVACGIADMVAMAYAPEYQSPAIQELDQLLKEIA